MHLDDLVFRPNLHNMEITDVFNLLRKYNTKLRKTINTLQDNLNDLTSLRRDIDSKLTDLSYSLPKQQVYYKSSEGEK
jgi:hypothetical protein